MVFYMVSHSALDVHNYMVSPSALDVHNYMVSPSALNVLYGVSQCIGCS